MYTALPKQVLFLVKLLSASDRTQYFPACDKIKDIFTQFERLRLFLGHAVVGEAMLSGLWIQHLTQFYQFKASESVEVKNHSLKLHSNGRKRLEYGFQSQNSLLI